MDELKAKAQSLADAHYKIATRTDETAHYLHPVYRRSQRELRMAIARAYGPALVGAIVEIWVDCGEPLSACADIARVSLMDEFELGESRLYCDRNGGTGEGECARIPHHEGACDDGAVTECPSCGVQLSPDCTVDALPGEPAEHYSDCAVQQPAIDERNGS